MLGTSNTQASSTKLFDVCLNAAVLLLKVDSNCKILDSPPHMYAALPAYDALTLAMKESLSLRGIVPAMIMNAHEQRSVRYILH